MGKRRVFDLERTFSSHFSDGGNADFADFRFTGSNGRVLLRRLQF